jgi:hypothetical protein
VIPAGATVNGRVVESRHSSRAGQEAVLRVAFTSVSYGGGSYPIDATAGAVPSKLVSRDSNAEKAAKVGGGVALGAILGHVIGHGTGATVAGAVAGAAAGTAVAIGTATVDRVIPAGSRVELTLDAPVEVKG